MHGRNTEPKSYKIAILWRGDAEARQATTPQNNRFYRIFEVLAAFRRLSHSAQPRTRRAG